MIGNNENFSLEFSFNQVHTFSMLYVPTPLTETFEKKSLQDCWKNDYFEVNLGEKLRVKGKVYFRVCDVCQWKIYWARWQNV